MSEIVVRPMQSIARRIFSRSSARSRLVVSRNVSNGARTKTATVDSRTDDAPKKVEQPRRTQEEQDAALMEAYREKFGGDITATFENGKASEMSRSVRNNMFRCKSCLSGSLNLTQQIYK